MLINQKSKEIKNKVEEYVQSKPSQLELFECFDNKNDIYSNTIELYDQMPKYYFGGVEREGGKKVDALPILERNFIHRSEKFSIRILPAALMDRNSGRTVHYYPSQREELVEDALRKIIVNKGGVFLDNDVAVKFTLYELQQELQKSGHGYNLNQIKEAIEVCNKTIVEIIDNGGNNVSITSSIFPFVGMENASAKSSGVKGKDKVVIMFHPLVTKSINQRTYRLYNYNKVMSYKMMISRWLHKRISHNFTQANTAKLYNINLTTIVRDSGMKVYERNSDSLKQIIRSLEEMINTRTLTSYNIFKYFDKRKLKDVRFDIYVSDEFVADVKKASKLINLQIESSQTEEFTEKTEEIRNELLKPIYGLSFVVVNNIVANIKDRDQQVSIINSLMAARELFEKDANCNHPAVTKTALKEGWKPRKSKPLQSILEKAISQEEAANTILQLENEKKKGVLQSDKRWKKIQKRIKSEFSEKTWDTWLSKLDILQISEKEIVLAAPDKFYRDNIIKLFIETKTEKTLLQVVQKISPEIEKVKVGLGL